MSRRRLTSSGLFTRTAAPDEMSGRNPNVPITLYNIKPNARFPIGSQVTFIDTMFMKLKGEVKAHIAEDRLLVQWPTEINQVDVDEVVPFAEIKLGESTISPAVAAHRQRSQVLTFDKPGRRQADRLFFDHPEDDNLEYDPDTTKRSSAKVVIENDPEDEGLEYIPDEPDFFDGDPVDESELGDGELPADQDPRDKIEEEGEFQEEDMCGASAEMLTFSEPGDMTDVLQEGIGVGEGVLDAEPMIIISENGDVADVLETKFIGGSRREGEWNGLIQFPEVGELVEKFQDSTGLKGPGEWNGLIQFPEVGDVVENVKNRLKKGVGLKENEHLEWIPLIEFPEVDELVDKFRGGSRGSESTLTFGDSGDMTETLESKFRGGSRRKADDFFNQRETLRGGSRRESAWPSWMKSQGPNPTPPGPPQQKKEELPDPTQNRYYSHVMNAKDENGNYLYGEDDVALTFNAFRAADVTNLLYQYGLHPDEIKQFADIRENQLRHARQKASQAPIGSEPVKWGQGLGVDLKLQGMKGSFPGKRPEQQKQQKQDWNDPGQVPATPEEDLAKILNVTPDWIAWNKAGEGVKNAFDIMTEEGTNTPENQQKWLGPIMGRRVTPEEVGQLQQWYEKHHGTGSSQSTNGQQAGGQQAGGQQAGGQQAGQRAVPEPTFDESGELIPHPLVAASPKNQAWAKDKLIPAIQSNNTEFLQQASARDPRISEVVQYYLKAFNAAGHQQAPTPNVGDIPKPGRRRPTPRRPVPQQRWTATPVTPQPQPTSSLQKLRHEANRVGEMLRMPRTAEYIHQAADVVDAVREIDHGGELDTTTKVALKKASQGLLDATDHLSKVNNKVANRVAPKIETLYAEALSA